MTACSRAAVRRSIAALLKSWVKAHPPEPEAIAHHSTQAGLDDFAIEWWGKAGDQALRRSAFQKGDFPCSGGKAIAMADNVGSGSRQEAGEACAARQRLTLQTNYGQAMMWSKGYAAEETKAAFARAAELAGRSGDLSERFDRIARPVGCSGRGRGIVFRTRTRFGAAARSGGCRAGRG